MASGIIQRAVVVTDKRAWQRDGAQRQDDLAVKIRPIEASFPSRTHTSRSHSHMTRTRESVLECFLSGVFHR